jgi:hypothetical protein
MRPAGCPLATPGGVGMAEVHKVNMLLRPVARRPALSLLRLGARPHHRRTRHLAPGRELPVENQLDEIRR